MGVYVYASLCDFFCIGLLLPFVLRFRLSIIFSIVFNACYYWWICLLVWLLSPFFFKLFFYFKTIFLITLFYFFPSFFFFSIFSLLFSHPSTYQAQPCLASEIRWDWARSGWYGHRLFSLFFWAVWLTESWCSGCVSDLSLWGGRAKFRTLVHQRPPSPS